jgi:protoporphyrinogen/coproporphyrinogen III oxidase
MPAPYPGAGPFKNIFWNGNTLLTEPVFEGFVRAIVAESWKAPREDNLRSQDESVASFVTRRLGPQIANNLVSAIYHGIYAGDIERLSAQMLLGPYHDLEKAEGRVIGPILKMINSEARFLMMDNFLALHSIGYKRPQSHWNDLSRLVAGSSVLTLKSGMSTLPERLQKAVKDSGKVEILVNTPPSAITRDRQTSDLTVCEA